MHLHLVRGGPTVAVALPLLTAAMTTIWASPVAAPERPILGWGSLGITDNEGTAEQGWKNLNECVIKVWEVGDV